MGEPILIPKKIPVHWNADAMIDEEIPVGGKIYRVTCVSMEIRTLLYLQRTWKI